MKTEKRKRIPNTNNKTRKGGENYIEKIQEVKNLDECKDGFMKCNEELQEETKKSFNLEEFIKEQRQVNKEQIQINKKQEIQIDKLNNTVYGLNNTVYGLKEQIDGLKDTVDGLQYSSLKNKILIALHDLYNTSDILRLREIKQLQQDRMDISHYLRIKPLNPSKYMVYDTEDEIKRKISILLIKLRDDFRAKNHPVIQDINQEYNGMVDKFIEYLEKEGITYNKDSRYTEFDKKIQKWFQ